MASMYARACIRVSNRFFNMYHDYPFPRTNVKLQVLKPNTFILTSNVFDNIPNSIKRVTDTALSIYDRAYKDNMQCIDEIEIVNINITNIIEPLDYRITQDELNKHTLDEIIKTIAKC